MERVVEIAFGADMQAMGGASDSCAHPRPEGQAILVLTLDKQPRTMVAHALALAPAGLVT